MSWLTSTLPNSDPSPTIGNSLRSSRDASAKTRTSAPNVISVVNNPTHNTTRTSLLGPSLLVQYRIVQGLVPAVTNSTVPRWQAMTTHANSFSTDRCIFAATR